MVYSCYLKFSVWFFVMGNLCMINEFDYDDGYFLKLVKSYFSIKRRVFRIIYVFLGCLCLCICFYDGEKSMSI